MSEKIEVVVKNSTDLGEGPHWDDTIQSLYYVDMFVGDVHRYNAVTGEDSRLDLGDSVASVIIPRQKGGFVVSQKTDLGLLDSWESGKVTSIAKVEADANMFNDGKVDASGRLWIGNKRTVADFSSTEIPDLGYPDGMTVDTEGKLWVACFDAGKVVRLDPETGKVIRTVKFPCEKITSCCFGGDDFTDLYVTSSKHTMTAAELEATPLAGSVFKVTGLGVRGRKANMFSG
ncbi:regucalcin-like isoform X2 [Haliotis cracherodii]|uniref:regucalcin-like isoform X2 n=1 Tax=Haliotis cracherodii TaxID=6455 RepID=UPI0039EB868E